MNEFQHTQNIRQTFQNGSLNWEEGSDHSDARQFYAVSSSEEPVRRFKVILSSGETYSFAYSFFPIVNLNGNQHLTIKGHKTIISIEGRNLKPIEESLTKETLIWVRSNPSAKDDGDSPVFISNITVEIS